MIRLGTVLAFAGAEARLSRRLVRFWLFEVIAAVIGILFFSYYSAIHYFLSHWSATASMLNPSYLIGFIALYYIAVFLFGLVFLGYDVRARDERERICEVLDALPYSNLELMLGRFIGIVVVCWVPVLVICAVLAIIGLVIGTAIEPVSMVTFFVFHLLPAYCFILGLTFLLTMLLRHRLFVAIVMMALIAGLLTINVWYTPVAYLNLFDVTGGFAVPAPSDLLPTVIEFRGLLQRVAFLIAGLGLVWLAVAVHPRKDDSSRPVTAATGLLMLLVGFGINGMLTWETLSIIEQKREWKAIHAKRQSDPTPDLLAMRGEVVIDPGDSLSLALSLRFRAPDDTALQTALFSLNPGMTVKSVAGPGGSALSFEQDSGLFEIDLGAALPAGSETTVDLEIEGFPDQWFAYLDSSFEPFELSIREGNIFILGFYNQIFTGRYAALLPGTRWLPATGADVGRGDPAIRPADYFDVDLTVEVPRPGAPAGRGAGC